MKVYFVGAVHGYFPDLKHCDLGIFGSRDEAEIMIEQLLKSENYAKRLETKEEIVRDDFFVDECEIGECFSWVRL